MDWTRLPFGRRLENVVSGLRQCRLCLRITWAIFLAILLTEAAILIFSVRAFERDRLLEVEREALVVMRVMLRGMVRQGAAPGALQQIGPKLRENTVLIGARLHDKKGKIAGEFGALPGSFKLDSLGKGAVQKRRMDNGETMDVLWPAKKVYAPYAVAARIDTSEIAGQVCAFIWRIIGLILLITVVVTIVAMLVLERLMLRPIRSLRQGLVRVAEHPENTEAIEISALGKDELREVTLSFNVLTARLAGAFREIERQNADLAAQAKLQTELRQAAEAADHSKTLFLTNMSHELRTPLNAIIGYSEAITLETFGPLGNEKYKEYIGDIHLSGAHLLQLINDLLDMSAIEAGRLELSEGSLDVDAVIDTVVKLVQPRADAAGIDLQKRSNGALPVLIADERRVRQILLNLITNAVKFTQPGGEVSVAANGGGDRQLTITVTDDGIGMNDDDLSRALKPFGRASGGRVRETEGTGLGLPLTVELMKAHGGSLDISSQPEKGTRVSLSFPPERVVG
ncbi:MAG: ATP-binding protein [Rhodospirillales bacterium]|nr:ATP-binding protein [Rhodospirillales bacterium]MDP6644266.1 ATP-binding protein [Rhodospirillales bacterium]